MKDVLHLLSDPVVQIGAAIAAIRTAHAMPRGLHLLWAACADLLNDMRRHNVLGLDRRIGEQRSHWPERRQAGYRSRFAEGIEVESARQSDAAGWDGVRCRAVAIPDFQAIMRPLLLVLEDGQERSSGEIRAALAAEFSLTEEELAEMIPSGRAKTFANRVAWAITHM